MHSLKVRQPEAPYTLLNNQRSTEISFAAIIRETQQQMIKFL